MVGVRDYSPTAASNLSVGGISIAEGWARASVNNAYRAGMADTANLLLDLGGAKTTTGSANAYLISLDSAPTAYANNLLFLATANHSNTGAATININGIGVKDIKKILGGVAVPLEAGDFPAGHIGIFTYSSSNNSVIMANYNVTSYIPPSGIIRTIDSKLDEIVSFTDFIASTDPDSTLGWNRFGAWARTQSVAGKGVELILPPGLYNFNHKQSYGALLGIKRLRIIGYGAAVQNTYDPTIEGAQFGFEMHFHVAYAAGANLVSGYRINTAAIGDTTVTLQTASGALDFAVGTPMLIGSMDIQGYGQPLNVDRFDFVQITAINTSTGVLTFAPSLRNYHRDDFADWPVQQWGKARAYWFDYVMPSSTGLPGTPYNVTWDVEHHYEGFEIRPTINGNYPYWSVSGKHRTFKNMKMPGLSESVMERLHAADCFFSGMGEPDKVVGSIEYDSCIWDSSLIFQSGSINNVSLRNCKTPYCGSGTVKSFTATACDFDSWTTGALYGRARSRVLIGCRVGSTGDFVEYPLQATSYSMKISAADAVSYANGVFTIVKATANGQAWNLTPGQACQWVALPNIGFSGQCFYVTRVYDDATNIYVETTSPYTAVPSWTITGSPPYSYIKAEREGSISFIDCYGGDGTRRITEATRAGERVGEYYKDTWAGQWDVSGYWSGRAGILKRIVIDVRQACAVAGSKLAFSISAANATTLVAADTLTLDIKADLTVKGRRDFTLTALTGKVAGDVVNLGGVAQTTLPANRTVYSTLGWNTESIPTGSIPVYQMPVVEVEMYFDSGMYLRPLTAWGGHQHIAKIAAVIGTHHP